METQIPSVRHAAPRLHGNGQNRRRQSRSWTTEITGTTPELLRHPALPARTGRLLTQADGDSGAKVVVLGQTVVDQLYGPRADPVGQLVRTRNVPFESPDRVFTEGELLRDVWGYRGVARTARSIRTRRGCGASCGERGRGWSSSTTSGRRLPATRELPVE